MNFRKASIFQRDTEKPEEQNDSGGMLAVWGSPGSGKTITAVKIAKMLSARKKNVILLLCDMAAPMLPCICPADALESKGSLAGVLAAARISENLIKHNLVTFKRNSCLAVLGLLERQNEYSTPPFTQKQVAELLDGLRQIAPYVIVDCGSYIANDILSAVALMEADSILRLANCDPKSVNYFASQLPLLDGPEWDMDKQYKVASNVKPYQAADHIGKVLGDTAFVLPYSQELEEQYLAGNLLADLTLKDSRPFRKELEKIIESALENFFGTPLFYFSPSDRTYSVLLHCSEEEGKDLILKINNCILRLHDYLLDTYDIWLFAGIGRNTDSLMNVWECYQQASEAVSYTTKNYIFFPYEFIKKDSNVFYYPPEISTKLIHFISTGNTSQVLELFNLIHQENIEERTLPVNLLKYLLSDIRNTLLKARFALPQDADPEAVKVLDERFNEHLTFKLCEDLALSLCNLFGNKEDDNTLSSTIEKYIKDNYKDPSLGLNKISDEFQISESYFSHMFKEKTGVNFSTYLENIRMTEAARLIKETDISLNELYIAVGYNNSNTFRRAFKKVYGVTPSAMREK